MVESVNQLHRYLNGHRGKLYKQGHVFKKWKLRYFVLEKKTMKYFDDEYLSKINGEYNLSVDSQIFDVPGESDGHKYLFYMTKKNDDSTEDILFVSASSEKEKKEWIEAISDAIHDGFKLIKQPELWIDAFYPLFDLSLVYPNVLVENGNIIKPALVEQAPKVSIRSPVDNNISNRFSLIMVDFDAVGDGSSDSPLNTVKLHWGVVNMLGSDLATGHEIVSYKSPAPAYNSGLHRFFFLLFRHPSVLSAIQLSETVEFFQKRDQFPLNEWASFLGLGSPVGINGFYAGWEDYCDLLHEKVGHLPPVAYRSHKQDSAVLARSEQYKIEQCKLDLYTDLTLQDVFPPQLVDIYAKSPLRSLSLNISFRSEQAAVVVVRDGNILSPPIVQRAPQVTFEPLSLSGDSCDYYSLVLCDPDAPSRVSPSMREFVHWVVVNIPGNDVRKGVEVVPYLGAAPPFASGLHRYVFSLYKQTQLLSPSAIENSRTHFSGRGGLQTHEWVRGQCAGLLVAVPVALEAFLCEWDPSVDALHAAMGWTPPVPYQSPSQQVSQSNKNTSQEQVISQLLREEEAFHAIGGASESQPVITSSIHSKPVEVSQTAQEVESRSSTSRLLSSSPSRPVSVAALVKKYSISNIEEKISAGTGSSSQDTQQSQKQNSITSEVQRSVIGTTSNSNSTSTTVTSSIANNSSGISSSTVTQVLVAQQTQIGSLVSSGQTDLLPQPQQLLPESVRDDHIDVVSPPVPPIQNEPSSPTGSSSSDLSAGGGIIQKKISFKSDVDGLLASEREKRLVSTGSSNSLRASTAATSIAPPVKKFVQRTASSALTATSGASVKKPPVQRSPSVATTTSGTKSSGNAPSSAPEKVVVTNEPTSSPKAVTSVVSTSPSQNISIDSISPSSRQRSVDESSRASLVRKTSTASSASSGSSRGGGGSSEEVRSRSLTARNTAELCEICGITTTSVFDGETLKKKFSKDFMFKDSFLWVEPLTRTLHWGKSVADKSNPRNQKYLALDHISNASRISLPGGEFKGVMRSLEVSGANIVITTESGEVLEMKLSSDGYPPANKRANDWAKVMRALSDGL